MKNSDTYSVRSVVVHGKHLGRTLGFPTANLKLADDFHFPLKYGVYAVKVMVDDLTFRGIANAGIRPTVDGSKLSIEVHLFDFEGNLYDKILDVHFLHHIRAEKKFGNLEELKSQITIDIKEALLTFS